MHSKFPELDIELLMDYLDNGEIEIDSEEDVFNAIEKWVTFDAKERKTFCGYLFNKIRMSEISYPV